MDNCYKDVDVWNKNVWVFIEFQTIRIPTERFMPFFLGVSTQEREDALCIRWIQGGGSWKGRIWSKFSWISWGFVSIKTMMPPISLAYNSICGTPPGTLTSTCHIMVNFSATHAKIVHAQPTPGWGQVRVFDQTYLGFNVLFQVLLSCWKWILFLMRHKPIVQAIPHGGWEISWLSKGRFQQK